MALAVQGDLCKQRDEWSFNTASLRTRTQGCPGFWSCDLSWHMQTMPGHMCLPLHHTPGRHDAKRGLPEQIPWEERAHRSEIPPQSTNGGWSSRPKNSNYAAFFLGVESALHSGSGAEEHTGLTLGRGSERLTASVKLLPLLSTVWNFQGPSRHSWPFPAFQGLNANHMQSCPPRPRHAF